MLFDSDDGGAEVVASAEQISVAVRVKDVANASEVRDCELEAIRQLRQMLP